MTINYSYTISNDVLHVTTSGSDRDLNEVKSYGAELIRIGKENNIRKVLADERELEYNIGVIDVFELAEYYSRELPHLAKIALVTVPSQLKDALFWETTSINRGLNVRVFTSIEEAKKWLEL